MTGARGNMLFTGSRTNPDNAMGSLDSAEMRKKEEKTSKEDTRSSQSTLESSAAPILNIFAKE